MPRVSLLVVNTKLGIPAAGTSVRAGCLQGGTGVEVILQPTCWVVRDNEECGRRRASISEARGLNAHTDDSGKQWSIGHFGILSWFIKVPKVSEKTNMLLAWLIIRLSSLLSPILYCYFHPHSLVWSRNQQGSCYVSLSDVRWMMFTEMSGVRMGESQ